MGSIDGSVMARVMEIRTPLGGDALLFLSMNATEALGRPFEYDIMLLSKQSDIDPDKLLGKNVTVKLELPQGGPRCFDGYVTRFGLVGMQGRYYQYHAVARPWLWLLTRTTDCRIFQNKKVPEIIKEIFDKYPKAAVDFSKLTGDYPNWDYQVQYRETDFNFVSRLMEQEGIYYYFAHSDGKHVLVLADSASAHDPYPSYDSISYVPLERGVRLDQEYVSQWHFARELQPGRYVSDDFDFEKPSTELQVRTKQPRKCAESDHEYYDYPGEYYTTAHGDHYVRTRLEELQVQYELAQGGTNARGVCCGSRFKLSGQDRQDQNREYLVVATTHTFQYNEYEATGGEGATYHCSFSALDLKTPFRPQRVTAKPTVQGPQTAIVVGPAGDQIHTDKYGRVKVQFHWDRYGKNDENSSCWIRVSHPWAGKGWGAVSIPRIGQEVIVGFLEGDPDRPIITGRVYNAEQMPPYGLPDGAVVSGIKTDTHKGSGYNEMSMDDTAGKEKITIHGQYDMATTVEHDQTNTVNNDQTNTIKNNRTTAVTVNDALNVDANRTVHVKGKHAETIDNGQEVTVTSGQKVTVTGGQEVAVTGGQEVTITGGLTETVTGDRTMTVTGPIDQSATATIKMHATGAGTYTSDDSLKLAVVGSMVDIKPDSITISVAGSTIKLDASGVSVNGTKISLNG